MTVVTTLPRSRPLTVADLDTMPDDDGHRYELVDGVLVVSPAPSRRHQRALVRLLRLVDDACPDDLETLPAPFDVVLADDTLVQPDLLVARRADFTDKDLRTAPVLALEVLSPSTRRFDLMLKRSRFEAAGIQSYWVVDPLEPSLLAWDLVDGAYVEVGRARGEESWTSTLPFAVTIRPSDLIA